MNGHNLSCVVKHHQEFKAVVHTSHNNRDLDFCGFQYSKVNTHLLYLTPLLQFADGHCDRRSSRGVLLLRGQMFYCVFESMVLLGFSVRFTAEMSTCSVWLFSSWCVMLCSASHSSVVSSVNTCLARQI